MAGPPQMLVIQTLVRTRPSATAWTRTSTAHVPKASRGRRVSGSRSSTAKPLRVKVPEVVCNEEKGFNHYVGDEL